MKICIRCKEEKGLSAFTSPLVVCKKCRNERNRELYRKNPKVISEYYYANKTTINKRTKKYYADNKQEILEQKKEYYQRNAENIILQKSNYRKYQPEKEMLTKARARAKKHGLDFNLDLEDIQIPETCPYLKIPLVKGVAGMTDSSPSLDRIDTKKGYVKGNVEVVSWRANRLKSDMSLAEVIMIAERLNEIHGDLI